MRRARDRARRAAQTAEERDARLRQIRDNRRQSLATESEEERAVRLQRMRDRLASETEEERAARLQQMSANQRHRLASETEEERADRLQQMRANQRHRLEEMPSFISRHQASAPQRTFTTTADPQNLQGKQLQAYTIVRQHLEADSPPPLRMIISGTAGTGKSYLIKCLRSSHPSIQLSRHPIHPPLQASPSGCAEDRLILPSSCPSHPSCNLNTMLHT